jgi:CheY-like chemotaxis protein
VRSQEQESDVSETSHFSLFTSHSRVPIIALTANVLTGDRRTCLEAGMDDFLAKPVRLEELSTMITKWVSNQTANELGNIPMTTHNTNDSVDLAPCLDDTILQNLKDLGGDEDPGFFITVVDQFLTDLPRHFESIKQAIDHQNSEALMKAAHACKGSSRSIGAISLADISYALELMGREGTVEGAAAKFEEWLKEQDRTTHALQQIRSEKLEVKS